MLTTRAKKELNEQLKKLETALLYGELNNTIRAEIIERIQATRLAIQEIEKLEKEMDR